MEASTIDVAISQNTSKVLDKLRDRKGEPPTSWAGVYHLTCAGKTNWQGFAQAVVDEAVAADLLGGRNPEVAPNSRLRLAHAGEAPLPTLCSTTRKLLRQFEGPCRYWRDAPTPGNDGTDLIQMSSRIVTACDGRALSSSDADGQAWAEDQCPIL